MRDSRFVGERQRHDGLSLVIFGFSRLKHQTFDDSLCCYRLIHHRTRSTSSVGRLWELWSTRPQRRSLAYLRQLRPNQNVLDDASCCNRFVHTRRRCESTVGPLGQLWEMDAVINLARGCIIGSHDCFGSREALTIHTFLRENCVIISSQFQSPGERSPET